MFNCQNKNSRTNESELKKIGEGSEWRMKVKGKAHALSGTQ
jgi:hypothetical protein